MGCVASRNGGCFCTGACQKTFPSTNPDEFAERIREWKPGDGACDTCDKTEAECFCVEAVVPGAEPFKGVFIAAERKSQNDLSEAAVEADKQIRSTPPKEEAPDDVGTEYHIYIRQHQIDGVTVYTAGYSFYHEDDESAGVDVEEESYIGAAGLERLLTELRVNLRED